VPELINQSAVEAEKNMQIPPSKEFFKLPIFLAILFTFTLKVMLGLVGAMMTTKESVFSELLFAKATRDVMLVALCLVMLFIFIPQAMEYQRLCKYLASLSDTDSLPCYSAIVGVLVPWVLTAILVHTQEFLQIMNYTTCCALSFISVFCTLIMYGTFLEQSMIHEKNFRDTLGKLVMLDEMGSDSDESDKDQEEKKEQEEE
jgi:hypothetical protein